jgi:hypothetical protein
MDWRILFAAAAVSAFMAGPGSRAATLPPASKAEIVSAATRDDTPTANSVEEPLAVRKVDDEGAGDAAAPTGPSHLTAPNNPTDLFSTREGFDAEGRAKPAFEAELWLYLPAVNATIGLGRPPGVDIGVSRPRPTLADVVSGLKFAFDCECTVRYGDFVGEVTVLYVATKQKTSFPPVPPQLPPAVLNTNLDVIYVSPGVGYRVLRTDHISADARVGFTYAALSADAEFALGRFTSSKSVNPSFIQAWLGGRIDYYPTPRWRIEGGAEATGVGEAEPGWDAKFVVTYLINKWVDVSLGYRGSQFNHDAPTASDGSVRSASILLYGPTAALGVRF